LARIYGTGFSRGGELGPTDCHTATRIGLAGIKGKGHEAEAHLAAVTGMSVREVEQHISSAFSVWQARSAVSWTLDLSMLTDAGVEVLSPPEATQRVQAAAETLNSPRPADGDQSGGGLPARAETRHL
jgi:hypothetical protein